MTTPSHISECWLLLHVLNEDWDAADAALVEFNVSEKRGLYEAVRAIRGALIDGRFDRTGAPPAVPRALHDGESET